MHVLVRSRVSLYENRGDFQLICEDMEERGEGKLRRAFELLKKKLELRGLFAPEHKKPCPTFPNCIGVITSATGAAIKDILTVLKRRQANLPIIIYPSLVQGDTAAASIKKAIETANLRKECDVLILARGGGSLEDLWPFNEEIVAQAIHESALPIISAVGHEVDYTIADFVADLRAPTPSAAAEIISLNKEELLKTFSHHLQQLIRFISQKLNSSSQQLDWSDKHLQQQHPKRKLAEKRQQLDVYQLRITQQQTSRLTQIKASLDQASLRLQKLSPQGRIQSIQHQIKENSTRLKNLMLRQHAKWEANLQSTAAKLHALSPLATLNRGYAIASKNQHVLTNVNELEVADTIQIRLAKGGVACRVIELEPPS